MHKYSHTAESLRRTDTWEAKKGKLKLLFLSMLLLADEIRTMVDTHKPFKLPLLPILGS